MVDELTFACPRCGLDVTLTFYGPCPTCRDHLRRVYADRVRVRVVALAHIPLETFNQWLDAPNDDLGGDTPWQWIDAGFTDQIIDMVKTLKRDWVGSVSADV